MHFLPHLLAIVFTLTLQASSTAVLVTFSDDICNSTAGNSLFSISNNEECQIMKYITSWNIDAVAAGCSVYMYDDPICTSNGRLAPAVGVCVKQNSSQEGVQVICNGRNAGTSALAPATLATSTRTIGASTSTATPTTIPSNNGGGGGGISKSAQIALATILPIVALAGIGVLGFYVWAKHRRGGYVRSSSAQPTGGRGGGGAMAGGGTYEWEDRNRGGHDTDNAQMQETKDGVVWGTHAARQNRSQDHAELDRTREVVEAPRGREAVEAP